MASNGTAPVGVSKNIKQLGRMDLPGGGSIVVENGYAYVGHMDPPHGTSIIDVKDPKHPKIVSHLEIPEGLHSHKVRVSGDIMLVNYERYKAKRELQAGLKIWRMVGDPHAIVLGLNFMVSTLIKLERYEEAVVSMQESIALCEQTKNRWGIGTAYRFLGLATLAAGQYIEAQGHFQKSLEIFGDYFEGWDIAQSLVYLGDATRMSGDLARAETIYRDALRHAVNAHAASIALDALLGLAQLYGCAGNSEKALWLSYYIVNHTASIRETKERANQIIVETEKGLDNKQIRMIKKGVSDQSLETIVNSLS